MRNESKAAILVSLALLCGTASTALAQSDEITLGAGVQTGNTIDVPVYIRDVSGTPLGMDQPSGSHIQSFSIKVNYSPTAPVQSVTFTRAGITAPLTPTFETAPSGAGTISLLASFNEATNLIPFTLNGASPGNQVAHLVFTFTSPAAATVNLTLDTTLTQLTNQGGTTSETVANGRLTLTGSTITLVAVPVTPTLDWRVLMLLAMVLAVVGWRMQA